MTSYTVVAPAVTVATGQLNPQNRRPEVVRLLKGETIEAPDDHPSILTLLSGKALRKSEDVTGNEHVTPRTILRAWKGSATATVNAAVAPIDAPVPVTDPNEI